MKTPTPTKADLFQTVELRDATRPRREVLVPDGYRLERTANGWRAHGPDWTGPERTHADVREAGGQTDEPDAKAASWASGDACTHAWC